MTAVKTRAKRRILEIIGLILLAVDKLRASAVDGAFMGTAADFFEAAHPHN